MLIATSNGSSVPGVVRRLVSGRPRHTSRWKITRLPSRSSASWNGFSIRQRRKISPLMSWQRSGSSMRSGYGTGSDRSPSLPAARADDGHFSPAGRAEQPGRVPVHEGFFAAFAEELTFVPALVPQHSVVVLLYGIIRFCRTGFAQIIFPHPRLAPCTGVFSGRSAPLPGLLNRE